VRTQQNRPIHTFTGSFDTIKLDFTPDPPLSEREMSKHRANYPTRLAKLHVYLDGADAGWPTPSSYLFFILNHLLDGMPTLIDGQVVTAPWFSDPWQFDIRGRPQHNGVLITLHVPERWVAIHNASVPLSQFGNEVIDLARRWMKYLEVTYPQELVNPDFNQQYLQFKQQLEKAKKALHQYGH
jgi:hypothetical protein